MSTLVDSITVGEVGEKNIEIRESVTDVVYHLSATSVSEIRVSVHDPGFKMHNNNYFMVGRRVVYDNVNYEISAVEVKHGSRDTCTFTARLQAAQKLRRETGHKNFGRISPTTFAQDAATRVGLKFFGQPSAVDGYIIRKASDRTDESTMDVLQRLCRDLEFICFEAKQVLFFASEKYIIANQATLDINVPSVDGDPFYASSASARRTVDGTSAAKMQAQLIKNKSAKSIYPGAVVKLHGLANFDTFMVDQVRYSASPNALVSIAGTSPEDSGELESRITPGGLPADEPATKPLAATSNIGDARVFISEVFPFPEAVNKSKGWEYVRLYKRLPLPYPWNNGVWDPPADQGYANIKDAMNEWSTWINAYFSNATTATGGPQ